MRSKFLCIAVLTALIGHAQSLSLPPDPDGTPPHANGFRSNDGQLTASDGTSCTDVHFFSEGMYPLAFCQIASVVSFSTLAPGDSISPDTLERWDMHLTGAMAQQVDPQPVSLKGDVKNYYFPACGPLGITEVQAYDGVAYVSVYPSIDLYLYGGLSTEKLAFVCLPSSDPSHIQMHFTGPSGIQPDSMGGVIFNLTGEAGHFGEAIAYQIDSTGAIVSLPWTPAYIINGNDVSFVTGSYDHALSLVILINGQPQHHMALLPPPEEEGLCWSTHFGGNKRDRITESTSDGDRNYYATGCSGSLLSSFPITIGGHVYSAGTMNAFLVKFDVDHVRLWTTILGSGSQSTTYPQAIALRESPSRSIYIGGYTDGTGLLVYPNGPAYQDNSGISGVQQGFIGKFNSSGIRQWITYYGNSVLRIEGMAILGKEQLVITGNCSGSLPSAQAPLLSPPAEQWNYAGSGDAFITLFDANDRSVWSTYYGGSGADVARDVRTYGKSIYILGRTTSPNIPTQNGGPNSYVDQTLNYMDAFLLEFGSNGNLIWGTYFGGSGYEEPGVNGLTISPITRDLYIVGSSWSLSTVTDFPVWPSPGSYFDGTPSTGVNGFIARFSTADRSRKWVTFFGFDPSYVHQPEAVIGDNAGNIYMAGRTGDGSLPITYLPYNYNQSSINADGAVYRDCFIVRFSYANSLAWCSYFGGNASSTGNERIETLTYNDYDIYAAGFTSKGLDLTSYFPLAQPADPAGYFDPSYNDVPPAQFDGFITVFCSEATKSLLDQPLGITTLREHTLFDLGRGWFNIQGQGDRITAFDILGRPVRDLSLHWGESGSDPFFLGDLARGIYILCADGVYQGKVMIDQ